MVGRGASVGALGGLLLFIITSTLLTNYASCGGMPCVRGPRMIGDCERSLPLCSTGVVPGSLLDVAIGADSPRTTTPFGLAMRAPLGTTLAGVGAAARPALRRCLMGGGNRVSFPIVNHLGMNNLAGGRTRSLVHRRLRPCLGRDPVIAIHVTGCGVSMLKRIGHPNAFAMKGRGMGVLRTLTVTKSVAICNIHSGIGLVHRSTGNGHRVVGLGLGGTRLIMSPCCCLHRGSVVCMAPGGAGTGGSSVNDDADV